jgi:hypothetical protein
MFTAYLQLYDEWTTKTHLTMAQAALNIFNGRIPLPLSHHYPGTIPPSLALLHLLPTRRELLHLRAKMPAANSLSKILSTALTHLAAPIHHHKIRFPIVQH